MKQKQNFYEGINILIFGEVNCGKSTLVNILLEEELSPSEAVPTTSSITSFKYNENSEIFIDNNFNFQYYLRGFGVSSIIK